MCMSAQVRTTLVLREDLYHVLRKRSKGRSMSKVVEELIVTHLQRKPRSLFGTMPKTSAKDVRDHVDRV